MDTLKDFLAGYERWLLAFHVIAVISWMAGMLYLPRLFVYHTETQPGSDASERFKRMETKLLKVIINPAMIAAWVLGLTLAWVTDAYTQGWFHAKFLLVIILSGLHGHNVKLWRAFQEDRNTRPARYFRIINEAPALLMVLIVILAVVRPF
ncbi:MAG: protoporphyrinogen oxidase HemJ [Alphaproteobacteria bacterium]|nr:protoporphyrinogen oxidase HemJ [Alphaproteobacteria bacterium]